MNKLCVVAYVFGGDYQDYIPLYVLSLSYAYPNYSIRIYLDRKLRPEVRKQVEYLKEIVDLVIKENFSRNFNLSLKAIKHNHVQRSLRWIIYDKAFEDYEALYIGDIDLLIFPEKKALFEQHQIHCSTIKKPYSNITRVTKLRKPYRPKEVARNMMKFGIGNTISYYKERQKTQKRLTGLHYIQVQNYFKPLLHIIPSFIQEINLMCEGKSKILNSCSFNDEAALYLLMECAGIGTPKDSTGLPYNISQDPTQVAYRPHHGLHLGIFRSDKGVIAEKEIISSNLYQNYYQSFLQIKSEKAYQDIEKYFSPYLKEILHRMERFYDKEIGNS